MAKAGMVASLPARTTVLAAANPLEGSYNKGRTLQVDGLAAGRGGGGKQRGLPCLCGCSCSGAYQPARRFCPTPCGPDRPRPHPCPACTCLVLLSLPSLRLLGSVIPAPPGLAWFCYLSPACACLVLQENLKISPAMLSRFDLIFLLLDRPDADRDKRLTEHVLAMHSGVASRAAAARSGLLEYSSVGGGRAASLLLTDGSSGDGHGGRQPLLERLRARRPDDDPLPQQLLRKYIAYARQYVHPRLTRELLLMCHATACSYC